MQTAVNIMRPRGQTGRLRRRHYVHMFIWGLLYADMMKAMLESAICCGQDLKTNKSVGTVIQNSFGVKSI